MATSIAFASNGIVLESVTEENYKVWSVLVKNYLQGLGVWDVVEAVPASLFIDHSWKRNNAKALHAIQLACGSDHVSKIIEYKTAREAWNALKLLFSAESKVNNLYENEECLVKKMTGSEEYDELYEYVERHYLRSVHSYGDLSKAVLSARFSGSTLIHVAAIAGNVEIVKALVTAATKEILEMEDDDGYTALALVASVTGCRSVAESLVLIDEDLLTNKSSKGLHKGLIPVVMAADMGHKELTHYLYAQTPIEIFQENNYEYAAMLLHRCIDSEIFEVALHLLQIRCQELPLTPCESDGFCPLLALAQRPSAFHSGTPFQWWQQWIYNNVRVPSVIDLNHVNKAQSYGIAIKITSHVEPILPQTKTLAERWCGKLSNLVPLKILGALLRQFQYPLRLYCPAIDHIYERKLSHYKVLEILSCMCERLSNFNKSELKAVAAYDGMLQAAKYGIIEFIDFMRKAKPELLWESTDQCDRGVFAHAILNRQQKVFDFLVHIKSGRKKKIICSKDIYGNNLLHMAATLGPSSDLNRRSGAALQMQRELKWFKAVEKIVHPKCKEGIDKDGNKPREGFSKSHKELVKDAEKWAKDTARSFIIVGTLIITIIFAAAFTVPGGYKVETGRPVFLEDTIFSVFMMADAFGLFTSSSSVLIFIWVLTSRYAEKDFLMTLPRKLLFGLLTLSFSVVSMLVAFCAAVFMTLRGYRPYVTWTAIILAVATVVLILLPSQLHLFFEIFGSTKRFKTLSNKEERNLWHHKLDDNAKSLLKCCFSCN